MNGLIEIFTSLYLSVYANTNGGDYSMINKC